MAEATIPESRLADASEEALARRVQDGCHASYGELFRRLRPRLIRVLTKRVSNHADAEDLAQQALLKAYTHIARYDHGRRFSAWLFTIAMRLATDHQRKAARSRRVGDGDTTRDAVDPAPLPDGLIAGREMEQRLWALADAILPPRQWTALWLHGAEQLTPREIGRAMGITTVHARVLLYRARKAMIRRLSTEGDGESPAHDVNPPAHVSVEGRVEMQMT